MENKYYIPELSEICSGFEIEYKEYDYDIKEYTGNWIKSNIDPIDGLNDEEFKGLMEGDVRVKYLDREDIESLGFEHDQTTKDGAFFYFYTKDITEKDRYSLYCKNVHMKYGEDYTHISIKDRNEAIFCGTIKNKSELKRLMKQIGIEVK